MHLIKTRLYIYIHTYEQHTYEPRSSFQLYVVGEEKSRQAKIMEAKKDMELCEIKNGRLAMVNVKTLLLLLLLLL